MGASCTHEFLWYLSFIGILPFLHVIISVNLSDIPKKTYILCAYSFIYSAIFYGISLFWIREFGWYTHIVLIIYESIFMMLFGALSQFFILRKNTTHKEQLTKFFLLVFGLAFLWVSCEYLRSLGPFGFSWYSIHHLQAYNKGLIQYTSILGPFIIDFTIVSANLAFLYMIYKGRNTDNKTSKSLIFDIKPLEEFSAFIVFLIFLIAQFTGIMSIPKTINVSKKVSILQGSMDMYNKTDYDTLDVYKKLIKAGSKEEKKVDLYVMPETVFSMLRKDDWLSKEISNIAKSKKTPIILGANTPTDTANYFNSALLIDKNGKLVGKQDKIHLVPYGEYVPYKKILPYVHDPRMRENDVLHGTKYQVLSTGDIRAGVNICFDSSFESLSRIVSKDANLLVVITNDWWFGNSYAPRNHMMMSILRAVENRRFLIRCGSNGISCVINPYGEIIKSTNLNDVTCLNAEFDLISQKTFYTKYGNIFPYVGILIWLCLITFIISIRRKK